MATLLSKNFTLEELTDSAVAKRNGIKNQPSAKYTGNLRNLAVQILQPVRNAWGRPIVVSSGYRSLALNTKIGGALSSDHCFGCAADIHTVENTPEENRKLWALIISMCMDGRIKTKQVINEYGFSWIHVSWQDGRSQKQNQFLDAKRVLGKTQYVISNTDIL